MLNKLQKELKKTMKNGDKNATVALRNFIGKIKSEEINKGNSLNESESIKVLHISRPTGLFAVADAKARPRKSPLTHETANIMDRRAFDITG